MIKKFTERTGMNLYAVNEEVLKEWDETDLFHKSIAEREGCPAPSRTCSAVTKRCKASK